MREPSIMCDMEDCVFHRTEGDEAVCRARVIKIEEQRCVIYEARQAGSQDGQPAPYEEGGSTQ